MDETVAVAWLPSVLYRSGQLLDMPRLVEAAHEKGILIGFDCAHSVGALPHEFDAWQVDFAVWCTYKYLNAGPGAVGALYVKRAHWGTEPALAGWWGYRKDRQFEMSHDWEGAPHAGAYQISTLPLLSSAALIGSLDIFAEAGIERVRQKSLGLTDYLIKLIEDAGLTKPPFGFGIGTPLERTRRGGHVALEHPRAEEICAKLIGRKIIVDFRHPDVIRLAPVALYTSFGDLHETIQALQEVILSLD
jgi:kynureninase